MKKLMLISVFVLVAATGWSQEQKSAKSITIDGPVDNGRRSIKDGGPNYIITAGNDTVYYMAEVEPKFPGGSAHFYNYFKTNFDQNLVKYAQPPMRVLVMFTVEKDGSLTHIKIIRSISAAIDSETLRVVRLSPKWRPGIRNNKICSVKYVIPINLIPASTADTPVYVPPTDTLTSMSKPHFRGGKAAYYKFLADNLQWPDVNQDLHGQIHIAFIVEEDGTLRNIHVVKGINTLLNAEALRVIKLSGQWVPAKVNHVPVRYYYRLHINYRMND